MSFRGFSVYSLLAKCLVVRLPRFGRGIRFLVGAFGFFIDTFSFLSVFVNDDAFQRL
jgi:hypothetical protein